MEIRTLTKLPGKRVFIVLLAAYLLALLVLSAKQPTGDFGNYYFGSYYLLKGQAGNWIYEPYLFNTTIYKAGYQHLYLSYTAVPPFSLPAYLIIAFMPLATAKVCWNVLCLALFALSLWRLLRYYGFDPRWILPLCLLLYTPLRSNLNLGQSYLLVFTLLAEGLLAYAQGRKWVATLLWSIALHLKLFPGIVVLFLLFRRDWKACGWYLLNTIAILLVTVLFTGTEIVYRYFTEVMPRLAEGEINNTFAVSYQSMQVWLRNLLVYDALHNPTAAYPAPLLYLVLNAAFKGVVLWLVIAMLPRFTSLLQSFSAWIFGMMLLSGYGNTYGLILLLFPALALIQDARNIRLLITLALLALLVNIPIARFAAIPGPAYIRLWLMLALFAWFCIRFRPVPSIPSAIFPVIVAVYLATGGIYRAERTSSGAHYFLKQEEALLIYDYTLQGDSLSLSIFDEKGPSQKKIPLPFPVYRIETINPSQYLPTEDFHARTRQAGLVNDSLILFLSDRNRGVGFYTLRCQALR